MDRYRKDLTGPVLEYAVKKYKSHRRLSSSLQLEKVEKEYLMEQNTMTKFFSRNAIYDIFCATT